MRAAVLVAILLFTFNSLTGESKTIRKIYTPAVAGFVKALQYKKWNGELISTDLENLHWIDGPWGVWNVSDPDFQHNEQNNNYNSEFIEFISDIGEKWISRCHAHSKLSGDVWFTFEHFKDGDQSHGEENQFLHIQDWNGTKWRISIPGRNVNHPCDPEKVGTSDPKEIVFYRQQLP